MGCCVTRCRHKTTEGRVSKGVKSPKKNILNSKVTSEVERKIKSNSNDVKIAKVRKACPVLCCNRDKQSDGNGGANDTDVGANASSYHNLSATGGTTIQQHNHNSTDSKHGQTEHQSGDRNKSFSFEHDNELVRRIDEQDVMKIDRANVNLSGQESTRNETCTNENTRKQDGHVNSTLENKTENKYGARILKSNRPDFNENPSGTSLGQNGILREKTASSIDDKLNGKAHNVTNVNRVEKRSENDEFLQKCDDDSEDFEERKTPSNDDVNNDEKDDNTVRRHNGPRDQVIEKRMSIEVKTVVKKDTPKGKQLKGRELIANVSQSAVGAESPDPELPPPAPPPPEDP